MLIVYESKYLFVHKISTYVLTHTIYKNVQSKWTEQRRRWKKKKVERNDVSARSFLPLFFFSIHGVSVKLIKFRENFYNTR